MSIKSWIQKKVIANTLKGTDKEKALANVDNEPWVKVLNVDVNEENVSQGFFELDWNDPFVAMLRENGYEGDEDELIVDKWFSDLCKTIVREEIEDEYDLLGVPPNIVQLKDGKRVIE